MAYYNLYFSPTGGTKKVADAVAQGWDAPFLPLDLLKGTDKKHFTSEDLCLLAVPSYGGRVPSVVVDQLHQLCGNGAKAVLIAVYGNRAIDDTLLELSDEMQQAGFRCIAAISAVAQHSLLPQFGAGRPDAEDQEKLADFARRIKAALESGQISAPVNVPGNRPYRKYSGVPMKPSVADGCIGCGICAEECPTGAIPMMNFRFTDGRKCISCMHCVAVCPKHVRKISKVMQFMAGQKMKKSCSDRKDNLLYL